MGDQAEGKAALACSFCGKTQGTVEKLIAGPGVHICNECIDLCNEIIVEEGAGALPAPTGRPLPRRRLAEVERKMSAAVDAVDDLLGDLRRLVDETDPGPAD